MSRPVLPSTGQECPLWWGIPRLSYGRWVAIREWEGEPLPCLVGELVQKKVSPLPTFPKCLAVTSLPLISFHPRLHNHHVKHPKNVLKSCPFWRITQETGPHGLLPPLGLIFIWTNLSPASVNVLKMSLSLGARGHPPAHRLRTGPQDVVSESSCCPRGPVWPAGPSRTPRSVLSNLHSGDVALAPVWGGAWVWDRRGEDTGQETKGQDEAGDLEDRGKEGSE